MTAVRSDERLCEWCGRRFTPAKGNGARIARFCSDTCRGTFHRHRRAPDSLSAGWRRVRELLDEGEDGQ